MAKNRRKKPGHRSLLAEIQIRVAHPRSRHLDEYLIVSERVVEHDVLVCEGCAGRGDDEGGDYHFWGSGGEGREGEKGRSKVGGRSVILYDEEVRDITSSMGVRW